MTSVRRMLMTADAVGGVWTYCLELARELANRGIEIALATMGPRPSDAQRREAAGIGNLTLYESGFRLEWMDNAWDDVERAGVWLLELERSVDPTIIHLNGYVHGALGWHAPAVVVAHSCVFSWFEAVRGSTPPTVWSRYHQLVAKGIHRAAAVAAPSRAMLDAIGKHYGEPARARVIYNGRDSNRFRAAKKRHMILAAGRVWDEAKNAGSLVSIASRLPWPLFIAGELPDQVRPVHGATFLGSRDSRSMAQLMSRAAIFAAPARYEPFGLAALEAGLSGCALVLGDIRSLREIWDDAAMFVDPDDPEELLATLIRLSGSESLRAEYSERALLRAARFSSEKMGERYADLYDNVLQTRHHAAESHWGAGEIVCV